MGKRANIMRQVMPAFWALGLGAATAAWMATIYRREQEEALLVLRSGSQILDTADGVVEFAQRGQGPAVLVIHGGGGGYDQGLVVADFIAVGMKDTGFRFIAPSRFGYLRTPLPADSSPAAQADLHAALLDALALPEAVVVGVSAGGPSACWFALRHPGRCRALLLFSAITQPLPAQVTSRLQRLQKFLDRLPNFGLWLLEKLSGPRSLLWLEPSLRRCPVLDMGMLARFMASTMPLSERLAGSHHDYAENGRLRPIPFEKIQAPTLVIHGMADSLVPCDQALDSARRIPGATILPLDDGSHLWIASHAAETRPVIQEFLGQHTREPLPNPWRQN